MEIGFSKKINIFCIIIFLITATLFTNVIAISDANIQMLNNNQDMMKLGNLETEYWALLRNRILGITCCCWCICR